MTRIPVLRPRLPTADRLLPYLRRIDAVRTYSNYGPLVLELECRLAERFLLPAGGVVCASSGTAAIVGAIIAIAGRAHKQRPLAIIPSFTFVATASAVEQCGYQPHLVDVDAATWSIRPESLINHPLLDRVGLVIPVAPFGRPIAQEPWRVFRQKTNIPIVIDGAACFDTILQSPHVYLGEIPVALSFHATKSFGTGEGGAVATIDTDLASRVARALNFGFYGTRDSQSASTNGKMSEYHAAVGLAEFDGWDDKLSALAAVGNCYKSFFETSSLGQQLWSYPEVSSCYVLFACRTLEESERVRTVLDRCGVDFRLWYGRGVHHQAYFSQLGRDSLDVTDQVAPQLVGLPVAVDLKEDEIQNVSAAIVKATEPTSPLSMKS